MSGGACMVDGFSPITSSEGHRRAVLAGLDAFAIAANVLIDTELEPLLEHQIGDAFNDVQRVLEPFTHGFGLAVIAPRFFAFAVGDLDIIPPNISDVHFQFVGDLEDFVFQAPPPRCDIQIVGSEIRIDSSVAFDMRFRRKFTLSANASGEASGFLVGAFGFRFPIPSLAIFSFTTVDLRAIGPTFVGAISSNLHYRGGLHGSLAEPSLTIDEADVFLGFRVPLQTQRVAEGEMHSYLWTPLVFWLLVGLEVELEAYAELQAETVFDGHLQAPITLSNPSYRAGDLPDTDSFTSPLGHVFAKARALVTAQFSACVFFICVPVATKSKDKPVADTCQKVDHGALIPGVPGTECPTEVSQFAFSF
ncbi:MAG: hypothetical protein E6J91_28525 [Deltaproteobacteria bacterium]|nr:MAG: hypothetical protein E6J91_28525 [Deltaproteobacteria bacterium]